MVVVSGREALQALLLNLEADSLASAMGIAPLRLVVAALALTYPTRVSGFWYPDAVSTPKATPTVAKGLPDFFNGTRETIDEILHAIYSAVNVTLTFQQKLVLGICASFLGRGGIVPQLKSCPAVWTSVEGLSGIASSPDTGGGVSNFDFGAEPPPYEPDYIQYKTADYKLPPGFLLGVATSATQVEGAVKVGGRGPSIIDYLCHVRCRVTRPSRQADRPAQNINLLCNGFTSDVTTNSVRPTRLCSLE